MKSSIQSSQRLPREEFFILVPASLGASAAIDLDGVTEGTYQCTALRSAAGVYTINFTPPFQRVPVVHATALHATSQIHCTISAVTASAVTIKTWDDAGLAEEPTNLHVSVRGSDSRDGQI